MPATRSTLVALSSAIVLVTLFYAADPLYFPLIILGPPVTGFILGLRGDDWRLHAIAWGGAGVIGLLTDWLVYKEDVAFHAVVTVLMLMTSSLGWFIGRAVRRSRSRPRIN